MPVESHQIYQSMMFEIKMRIRVIDSSLNKSSNRNLALDAEFCFLQIRKILELICFSSILCDQARYKEFRSLEGETDDKDHGDYELDWNSRIILNKLKDISPHFMPIPLGEIHSSKGEHHFDRSNMNATHAKLIKMYKKCGSFMHIPKPFGESYESHISKQRQKYQAANETIKRYSEYLKALLWNHAAIGLEYVEGGDPLESANPQNAWIVHFGEYRSDEISIVVAVAV